jgi:hypothetical protein
MIQNFKRRFNVNNRFRDQYIKSAQTLYHL